MDLFEGQVLKTEENSFVLVRANKDSSELVAVELDILSKVNSSIPERDRTPSPSDFFVPSNEDVEEMIREVLQETAESMLKKKTENVLPVKDLTAEEIFKQLEFDLKSAFLSLPETTDTSNMIPNITPNDATTHIRIQENSSDHQDPIKDQVTSKFALMTPTVERRMPLFNKLTKLQFILRQFEKDLENIQIPLVDLSKKRPRERKQSFKILPIRIEYEPTEHSTPNLLPVDQGKSKRKPRKARKLEMEMLTEFNEKDTVNEKTALTTKKSKIDIKRPQKLKKAKKITTNYTNAPGISVKTFPVVQKPLKPSIIEYHSSDEDTIVQPSSGSLRCNYCFKQFLTGKGLSTHLKNCSKINEQLSKFIDEGCDSPNNLQINAADETDDLLIEALEEMGEGCDAVMSSEINVTELKQELIEDLESILEGAPKNEMIEKANSVIVVRQVNETPKSSKTKQDVQNKKSYKRRQLFSSMADNSETVPTPVKRKRGRPKGTKFLKNNASPVRHSARLSRL